MSNAALPAVVPTSSGRAALLLPDSRNNNAARPDAVPARTGPVASLREFNESRDSLSDLGCCRVRECCRCPGGRVVGCVRIFVFRREGCRVQAGCRRVVVMIVEGFRVPAGALSHEGGLSSYSPVNSPRCGNPPAGTREPSCESSLTPKEPHRGDKAGPRTARRSISRLVRAACLVRAAQLCGEERVDPAPRVGRIVLVVAHPGDLDENAARA